MTTELENVCKLCAKTRVADNREPNLLIEIGKTERKQLPVSACDYCDGGLLRLSLKGE